MSDLRDLDDESKRVEFEELTRLLPDASAESLRSDWKRGARGRVAAVRGLASNLVRRQTGLSSAQREALLRLIADVGAQRRGNSLDREWVGARLVVDGVQSPEGAEVAAAEARRQELKASLERLLERHRHQLTEKEVDFFIGDWSAGNYWLAVPDLVKPLVARRVPVTPAERDDLARVAELVGPNPEANMPDPVATIRALNVVKDDHAGPRSVTPPTAG